MKGIFPIDKFRTLQTPFYYYDTKVLRDTLSAINHEVAKYPNYSVHYAVKANANPKVLTIIRESGMGADCVSGGEIRAAIRAGFPANKVVFAGVKEAPPLKTQLFAFSDWISEKCKLKNGYAESVFWAKPTLFDYPFIDGLFLESGVPSPFYFRKVVDMSSYIISAFKNVHYAINHHTMSHHQAYESYWASFEKVRDLEKEKNTDGERSNAHNASADCIFQLDWLKEAIGNCNYYISEKGVQETLTRKD